MVDEKQVIEKYQSGVVVAAIAKEFSISKRTVYGILKWNKIPLKRKKSRYSVTYKNRKRHVEHEPPFDKDEFTKLWNEGKTIVYMCGKLNTSNTTVTRYVKLWGLPRRNKKAYSD